MKKLAFTFVFISVFFMLCPVFSQEEFRLVDGNAWPDILGPDTNLVHFEVSLLTPHEPPGFFGDPTPLERRPAFEDEHPRKAVDHLGNAHVVWMSRNMVSTVWEIWYQMLDATTGTPLTAPFMVSENDRRNSVYPAVAVDLMSGPDTIFAHIVWIDQRKEYNGIYYSKIVVVGGAVIDLNPNDWRVSDGSHHSGRAVFPEVDNINATFIEHPDIDTDSNGNIHIVWSDSRDIRNKWEVYYQMQDRGPNVVPAIPRTIIDDTRISDPGLFDANSQCPVVAADAPDAPTGEKPFPSVYIAWQDCSDSARNGNNWEIWFEWIIPDPIAGVVNTIINDCMVTSAVNFPFRDAVDDGFNSAKPDIDADFGFMGNVGVHIVWMDDREKEPWRPYYGSDVPSTHEKKWEIYSLVLECNKLARTSTKTLEKRQSDMQFPGWFGTYTGFIDGDGHSMYPRLIVEGDYVCQHGTAHAPLNGIMRITWHDNRKGDWEIYYTEICNRCNNPQTDVRVTHHQRRDMYPDIGLKISHLEPIPNSPDIKWQSDRYGDWDILNASQRGDRWVRAIIDGHGFNMWPILPRRGEEVVTATGARMLKYGLSMTWTEPVQQFLFSASDGVKTTITDTLRPGINILQIEDTYFGNSIKVNLRNNTPVAGFQFTMTDIPNRLYVITARGVDRAEDFNVSVDDNGTNAKILVYSAKGVTITPGKGAVVELDVLSITSFSQPIDLKISHSVLSDSYGSSIRHLTVDGRFYFGKKGDINLDGVLDVRDVVLMVNIILGKHVPDDYEKWAADMDNNGEINVRDLVLLVDAIMAIPQYDLATETNTISTAHLFIPPVELTPHASNFIPIILNTDEEIAGVQLEIKYDPVLFSVARPLLTNRSAAMSFDFVDHHGTLLMLLYSECKNVIAAGDGAVLSIPIELNEDVRNDVNVTIENALVVNRNAQILDLHTSISSSKSNAELPQNYDLKPNFPNPFNSATMIRYQLPETKEVKIQIFNSLGQKIKTLVNTKQPAGFYDVNWDGKNGQGEDVATGIYMLQMQAGKFMEIQKMILLR